MKILVLSAHSSGLDRRIVVEANTLFERGFEVTLLSLPASLEGSGLKPEIRVFMPPVRERRFRKLLVRGYTLIPLQLRKTALWFWSLLNPDQGNQLSEVFFSLCPEGEEFDVIHCHDLTTLPAGIAFRKRWPSAKIVYDAHELYPYQFPGGSTFERYWEELEKKNIGEVDRVITVNGSIAREMQKMYGIPMPEVIYNSGESGGCRKKIKREEFLSHFNLKEDPGFIILFQGSFSEGRNLENLTLAMGRLKGRASLFYLGWGIIEKRLRRLVRKHCLKNVYFGRTVSQERLLDFVGAAEMGVIPYPEDGMLNTRFCSPNKLFDYIEAKIPVCASDLPELKRLVSDNRIGRSYPMRNVEEIACALNDCMDACRRGEFKESEQDAARDFFSWKAQGRHLVSIYESLFEKQAP